MAFSGPPLPEAERYNIYGDWFEKLKNSKEIFEFRVKDSNKFFRLFAFWDSSGDSETLIILNLCFNNHQYPITQFTYIPEIDILNRMLLNAASLNPAKTAGNNLGR